MKGLLTVIQVIRPEPTDTNPRAAGIEQWTEKDQIDQGAILSALSDTLFDVYCSDFYTAKSLWDELIENIILKSKGSKNIMFSSSCGIKWLRTALEEHRNQTNKMPVEHQLRANLIVEKQKVNKVGHWAKLCPNKKAKTGQATVNMVVGGSSGANTSGATEGPALEGQVPLKHNTSTPFKLWKGRNPSLKYFRVWGCLAKVLVPEHKRKKLGPKTVDAMFLGYVEISYALRFLIIKSEIPGIEVNTIVKFCDVFIKDVFSMKIGIPSSVSLDDSLTSTSIPEHVEKMTNVGVNHSSTSLTHEELDEPRRSKRARVVKNFGSDFITYNIEDDPITFKDAMASSKAKQWKEAVKSEMDSIISNGTWVLVDLLLGCTTIGCKWIFKKKLKPDGTVDKFKARLVAKGFKTKEGIDYFNTHYPVARLKASHRNLSSNL
ncbi:UNVERIFIED_CONTAM: putative mitochondrial protein [Sesamum latifolium]|uniref:Mitochondrial protein n=1 Tax=Sesamum latifolium TaxID=2727402 RepID=A0AAW2YC85_9LAMI